MAQNSSLSSLVYTYSSARSWFVIVHISTIWWCSGCPCLVFSVFFHIQPCGGQQHLVLAVSAASLSLSQETVVSAFKSRCGSGLGHTFSSLWQQIFFSTSAFHDFGFGSVHILFKLGFRLDLEWYLWPRDPMSA